MNIIINQKRLLNAVRTVERVVSKNISLPILNAILLRVENGKLNLSATNLEVGINCWTGAKIEKEGAIAVPAKIFSDFVGLVQDEKLSLSSERNTLFITSEKSKTQILGMKTDEFPIIPKLKNTPEFHVSCALLSLMLGKVVDAASLLETRPELNGVFMQISKDQITCAATDSFRLSEHSVSLKQDMEKSFIIPRSTVSEIIRLVAGKDEDVSIAAGDNQIAVSGSDFELISRLIDGKYPDYKKVIPEHFLAELTVPRLVLEQNARTAGIFSSNISDLLLKAQNGILHLSTKNSDKGEISARIGIQNKSADFSMSVNYHYLLDALKVITSDDVVLGYSGEGSPLVVRGVGDKQHTYVIMPLRS